MGTDDAVGAYFDEHWPGIAAELARWLPGRGVPRQDVGDVVQETAVRLLRRWPDLDRSEPLTGLARVVALNVWRDRVKAAARREVCVETVPEAPVEHVEREVVARAELRVVLARVAGLSAAQRDVIRAEVAAELTTAAPVPRTSAYRMALLRARRALGAPLASLLALRSGRRSSRLALAGVAGVGMLVVLTPVRQPHAGAAPPATAAPVAAAPVELERGAVARRTPPARVDRAADTGARAAAPSGTARPPVYEPPSDLPPLPPPPRPHFRPPLIVMADHMQEQVDAVVCRPELADTLCS